MGETIAVNRKARHEYTIEDTLEAGLVLTGTEIKSIRAGKVNLADAYARIERDEAGLERLLDRELIPRPPIQGDGFLGNVRTPWMDRSNGVPDGTVRIACTTPTPNAETPVLCGPALPSYPTHRVSD